MSKRTYKIMKDWTREEMESVILSTASRPTSMAKFRWICYGSKGKDESLAAAIFGVILAKAHNFLHLAQMSKARRITFDLRDSGHLVYSNRWGWRAP